MANDLESEIIKVLEQTKQEIRANMSSKRINASGRTSESLRVEKYADGLRLVGGTNGTHGIADSPDIYGSDTAPIPTLEFGRKSGKVPRGFYYIIKEWTREKGLNFASESERGTFAYFVARKIAREGTKRNEANADVYSTPVMNAKDRIEKAVKANLNNTLTAALTSPRVINIRGAFTN